ncbi:MAG: hypothetical protein ACOCRK_11680 [bacterium]
MNKFSLMHEYCKDIYYLAVERRTQIRNRINIIAGFGFSIIVFISTKILEKFEINNEINNVQTFMVVIVFLSFLAFVYKYLKSFGYSKINIVDSEDVRLIIKDISYDKNLSVMYDELYDYYEELNIDDAANQAENDIVNHYLAVVYSKNTNLIEENNKLLSNNLLCLSILILLNIVLLISFIGVI